MVFRIYILLILASFITLFTRCWIVGAGGLVFLLLLWPLSIITSHKQRRRNHLLFVKSLSCGIKSMKRQKQNFKAINFIFSRCPSLQKFFKKCSIIIDDINISGNLFGHNSDSTEVEYVTDIGYKHLQCNIWNDD